MLWCTKVSHDLYTPLSCFLMRQTIFRRGTSQRIQLQFGLQHMQSTLQLTFYCSSMLYCTKPPRSGTNITTNLTLWEDQMFVHPTTKYNIADATMTYLNVHMARKSRTVWGQNPETERMPRERLLTSEQHDIVEGSRTWMSQLSCYLSTKHLLLWKICRENQRLL